MVEMIGDGGGDVRQILAWGEIVVSNSIIMYWLKSSTPSFP